MWLTVESVSTSVPLKFQMPPPQANRAGGGSPNPHPSPAEPNTCVAVLSVTLELTRLTVVKFMSIPPELPAVLPVTAEWISSRFPLASMPPPNDPEPALLPRTIVSTSTADACR